MRFETIALTVLLAACSTKVSEQITSSSPQGQPPTKQTVSSHISKIFAESSHPADVLVTAPRPAVEQNLFCWLVCVKARVVAIDGHDMGFQTNAVFFQKQEMISRRKAEPLDKCEGFERVELLNDKAN
jgi:hypothetical protein